MPRQSRYRQGYEVMDVDGLERAASFVVGWRLTVGPRGPRPTVEEEWSGIVSLAWVVDEGQGHSLRVAAGDAGELRHVDIPAWAASMINDPEDGPTAVGGGLNGMRYDLRPEPRTG